MDTIKIEINDPVYPWLLKEIPEPPEKLYARGDTSLLDSFMVAIVGSRKCSHYGVKAAKVIAGRLASSGVTIVSGMAGGIDTAAHQGALESGGKTIAVLANGVDIAYPPYNKDLKRKIEESGLVISEYPDGTEPMPYRFPLRNRIISGISDAVVVVEAARRSGSIITCEAAVEQGRKVYAVPGNFAYPGCEGVNRLITDGATPIYDVSEFIRDLGIKESPQRARLPELSDDERIVFEQVSGMAEPSQEEIAMKTGMTPQKVSVMITSLELKGLVSTELGRVFLTP